MEKSFLLLLCALTQVTSQNLKTCNDQWTKYGACFRSNLAGNFQPKNGQRILVDDKKRIEQTVVDCFNQNECNNPTPTDQELSARSECFEHIRSTIRGDVETCVQNDPTYKEFQLPPNQVGGYDWALTISRIRTALRDGREPLVSSAMCTGRRPINELFNCVQFANFDFNQSSSLIPQISADYCTMKNQCTHPDSTGGGGGVDDACQQTWTDHLRPILCSCAQSIDRQKLGKYQDDYQTCVRAKGYTVDGGDPGPKFIQWQVRFCEACF